MARNNFFKTFFGVLAVVLVGGAAVSVLQNVADIGKKDSATGSVCEHEYQSSVTKAPTCTKKGVMTYVCENCDNSYTEDIPARHTYVDGVCSVCNAADFSIFQGEDAEYTENEAKSGGLVANKFYRVYRSAMASADMLETLPAFPNVMYITGWNSIGIAAAPKSHQEYYSYNAGVANLPPKQIDIPSKAYDDYIDFYMAEGTYTFSYGDGYTVNVDITEETTIQGFSSTGHVFELIPGKHVHDYVEQILREPTCNTEGRARYVCECGDSYSRSLEKVHNFEGISCVSCGVVDWSIIDNEDNYTLVEAQLGEKMAGNVYRIVYDDVSGNGFVSSNGIKISSTGEKLYMGSPDVGMFENAPVFSSQVDGFAGINQALECSKNSEGLYVDILVRTNVNAGIIVEENATLDENTLERGKLYRFHFHDYKVTDETKATCTESGRAIYSCDCEKSYTQVLPATGHNYENGVCASCSAVDWSVFNNERNYEEVKAEIGEKIVGNFYRVYYKNGESELVNNGFSSKDWIATYNPGDQLYEMKVYLGFGYVEGLPPSDTNAYVEDDFGAYVRDIQFNAGDGYIDFYIEEGEYYCRSHGVTSGYIEINSNSTLDSVLNETLGVYRLNVK